MTKNVALATILSFFVTGLGQAYNGQILKGIALFIVQIINGMTMFFLIGFFTFPIVWLYSVWNAYTTAKRINEEQAILNLMD